MSVSEVEPLAATLPEEDTGGNPGSAGSFSLCLLLILMGRYGCRNVRFTRLG